MGMGNVEWIEWTDEEKEEFLKQLEESEDDIATNKPATKGFIPVGISGWICPVCGAGCSPHVNQCGCRGGQITYTGGTGCK